jgi:hypothetical protein
VKKVKQYLSVVFICWLVFCQTLQAQEVWPGDVNNNGQVNGVDLLYWGLAFGSTGPGRDDISTDWEALPLPSPWSQSFPNGLNYAYADCDGSGEVDEDDYDDAIEDNFGLTRGTVQPDGYNNAQSGRAPSLRLETENAVVPFGATVNISLSLDDSAAPLDNFYGMALKLRYTTDVLAGDDGLDFDFTENGWIEADNSLVQDLFVDNDGQGQADLAVTRTNQQGVSVGTDRIGNFTIVIEDIIVGRALDTFRLYIDSVLIFNGGQMTVPTFRDSIEIIVAEDPSQVVTSSRERQAAVDLRVYPNPAVNECFITCEQPLSEFLLTDQLGRSWTIPFRRVRQGLYHLRRPALPGGMYWLSARTSDGWINRSIIFLND